MAQITDTDLCKTRLTAEHGAVKELTIPQNFNDGFGAEFKSVELTNVGLGLGPSGVKLDTERWMFLEGLNQHTDWRLSTAGGIWTSFLMYATDAITQFAATHFTCFREQQRKMFRTAFKKDGLSQATEGAMGILGQTLPKKRFEGFSRTLNGLGRTDLNSPKSSE